MAVRPSILTCQLPGKRIASGLVFCRLDLAWNVCRKWHGRRQEAPQISPKQHGIECYVSPVKMINLNEVTFIYVHKCTYARGHMHMASQRQVCIGGCVHKSLVCGCSCVCMYTRYIDVACTCAFAGFMCIFAQLSICVCVVYVSISVHLLAYMSSGQATSSRA